MAIDFMVLPLSRYLSGDFITPAMRFAWDQGIPYTIVGPDGTRELPPGLPFGGADAPENRERFVPMVLEDLAALPAEISKQLWDESSEAEPAFHRVDPASYEALLAHFAARPARGLLGWRKEPQLAHAAVSLLVPSNFEAPIEMASPFERTVGSAPRALRELARAKVPNEARSALETLRGALDDAVRLRLPLIVDW